MPTTTVLFDFDGTLADSFTAITSSVNYVRRTVGLAELPPDQVRAYVGYGLRQLMTDLVPGITAEDAIQIYTKHHETIMLTQTTLLPGVSDTISKLHERAYKLGVCSNKKVAFTKQLVSQLGLGPYMKVILGPEDVGAAKPDPAMLMEACRRLQVTVQETLYIGDMSVDVVTAKKLGMAIWLVPALIQENKSDWQELPDAQLSRFSELLDRLPGLG